MDNLVLAKISKNDITFVSDEGETSDLNKAIRFEESVDMNEFSFVSTKLAQQIINNKIIQEG